jgi:hypothetical protein
MNIIGHFCLILKLRHFSFADSAILTLSMALSLPSGEEETRHNLDFGDTPFLFQTRKQRVRFVLFSNLSVLSAFMIDTHLAHVFSEYHCLCCAPQF